MGGSVATETMRERVQNIRALIAMGAYAPGGSVGDGMTASGCDSVVGLLDDVLALLEGGEPFTHGQKVRSLSLHDPDYVVTVRTDYFVGENGKGNVHTYPRNDFAPIHDAHAPETTSAGSPEGAPVEQGGQTSITERDTPPASAGVPPVPTSEERCPRCHENPATDDHTCPYQSEINDDDETLCRCCEDCEYECAQDI